MSSHGRGLNLKNKIVSRALGHMARPGCDQPHRMFTPCVLRECMLSQLAF